MTQREREILDIIRINPMISQRELADQLGITRSSASVHIGNLMKKGILAGKGYVIREETGVCVIGGANMDLQGIPRSGLKMYDSNPGFLHASPGGVGRNIAENLGRLKIPTLLFSVVGQDAYGDALLKSCKDTGVEERFILRSTHHPTSVYLSILDENRDMRLAINQMEILEEVNSTYLKPHRLKLSQAPAIVLDGNLTENVILDICQDFSSRLIFADPVSAVKSDKFLECLPKLYGFKPNRMEASHLLKRDMQTMDQIKKGAEEFLSKGIKEIYISMGEEGSLCANENEMLHIKASNVELQSATGAGDAFLAGAVYGCLANKSFVDAMIFATGASLAAISSKETIHPDFSSKKIQEVLEIAEIEVQVLSW